MTKIKCDVLIVGGGPVGAVAALQLTKTGLKVALVDIVDPRAPLPKNLDGRTVALASGTIELLENCGVWEGIHRDATPIQEIYVANHQGGGFVRYGQEESGGNPLGYNVEIASLRQSLATLLDHRKNLQIYAPSEIQDLSLKEPFMEVLLKNGEVIQASLVIGADGKNSAVRQRLHIQSWTRSYHHTALVFNVFHEKPHNNIAFENFLERGPIAFLPMGDPYLSSVIWSEETQKAEQWKTLNDETFIEEVHVRFPNLGQLKLASQRWSFPLNLTMVKEYKAPRALFVGDAAHAIHPVAGQGLNLGFRDLVVLERLIKEAQELGLDIGGSWLLSEYQKQRRFDVLSMSGVTHGLIHLFSNKSKGLGFLRGLGLRGVQRIAPLRRMLARHAMGLKAS